MKRTLLFNLTAFLLLTTSITFAQNALHFDRTGDYIQTTAPGVFNSDDRTFEAWIKVDTGAPAATLCILDYGRNASGARNTFSVTGTRKLAFLSGGTNGNLSSDSTDIIPEGKWTHVAFVLNAGTGFLYVNGEQVGTGNLSGVNTPSGYEDLKIGQRVAGGSILFQGAIDEVRIWDIARTQAEIQADTNREICPLPLELVSYFKFNQGIASGNNSNDTVLTEFISSNDGNLNSFALTGATSNWVIGKELETSKSGNDTVVACDSYISPSGKFTWTTTGVYLDSLTTGLGCDSIVSVDLTINKVAPSISLNGTTLTAGQAGATYQWLNCDSSHQVIIGETSQSYTAVVNGNYAVQVEKNGCIDTSACVEVIMVGINELSNDALSIYPNPSNGELFIKGIVPGKLTITDAKGVTVYEKTIVENTNEYISLPANIDNGMYLVFFQNNQRFLSKKLFILRN